MAKFSLRRYETQAQFGAVLSVVGLVMLIPLAVLVFRNIDLEELAIYYGNPLRQILVLGFGGLAFSLGFAASGLGYNSAGQRRNEKPGLSWLSFFLGAVAMCLAIILVFIFRSRGEFIG